MTVQSCQSAVVDLSMRSDFKTFMYMRARPEQSNILLDMLHRFMDYEYRNIHYPRSHHLNSTPPHLRA